MFNNFLQYEYQAFHQIYKHQVHEHSIYLGDVSAALDLQFISSHSIRTVVTAAIGMDHVSYDQTINHIIYPLLDMKSQNITKFFTQFYDLIEKQIIKGNVLVHCAAGISRSATLVISYLMKKNKWGFKQAIQFVRQKRASVCPNLGFQRQLKQYETNLNKKNHLQEVDLKMMPRSSEARKHVFSPMKAQILPQIGNFGHTQILRSKALQKYEYERLNKNIIPFTYSKNRMQHHTRKSQHDSKFLKKKAFFNKDQLEQNIQRKTKNLGQQRNINLVNMFNVFHDDRNPLQINSIPSKKLSSLSHRSQRVSQQSKKLKRNFSNIKNVQNRSNIEDIGDVIANKLNLHEKHFVTQKILRSRPLYKLANF